MLRVPCATMNLDLLGRWILLQKLADVNRREPQRAGTVSIQNGTVKESPESTLDLRRAEPAAILTVGPHGHECRKIAMLGSLLHFILKPAGIEAGELGIRKLPITRDNDDLRPVISGSIRTVA